MRHDKNFLIIYEDKSYDWLPFMPAIRYSLSDDWMYSPYNGQWYRYTHTTSSRNTVAECDVPPSIKAMCLLLI